MFPAAFIKTVTIFLPGSSRLCSEGLLCYFLQNPYLFLKTSVKFKVMNRFNVQCTISLQSHEMKTTQVINTVTLRLQVTVALKTVHFNGKLQFSQSKQNQ